MLGELDGEALGEPDDAELGSGVCRHHRCAPAPRARGAVENPATITLPNHLASGLATSEKRPSKIRGEDSIPLLDRGFDDRIDRNHTGVVDHDVKAAKGRDGALDTGTDVRLDCDIASDCKRGAGFPDLLCRGLGARFVDSPDADRSALADEPVGDTPPTPTLSPLADP